MNAEVEQLPAFTRISTGLRPVLLLAGIAAAVAAGLGIVFWAQGPNYSLLYSGLAVTELVEMQQTLQAAGIRHEVDVERGTVSVAADRLNDARLALAAQGVLQAPDGFTAMTRDSGFGVSQFMEGARYQHALESELARTIASLQPVAAARVHIAAPRQSAFVRDRRNATASVFVQLKAGRRLESDQVTAIVNLVASSIPELQASDVTVVDQTGRLLSQPERDGDLAAREQQFEFARRLESEYVQRIEALLTPIVGAGNVRAQVVASVDMSVTEEAREQYRPDSQVVRSEQLAEETSRSGAGAGGVPGALSNQPPAPGVALPAGQVAATVPAGTDTASDGGVPANTSRQSTRNYEIDRTVAYTRQPAGRLKRLTVAVLVDSPAANGKEGTESAQAPGAEQLARITTLVKDAVGFDAARGDSVNVVSASFAADAAEPVGEIDAPPIWQQPWVRELAKILGGASIVIVLLLAIVRPLVRSLTASPRLAAPAMPALAMATTADASADGEGARLAAPASPIAYEQQIAQARSLVAQDPKRVARVVKTWVGKDE